jgi:hypothetical protein
LIALVWPIVAFIVVASIIVHGSSVAVFTLGKHINTLTITMSYTQANEDGPSWMNRLPRISSQSRSQARTMSDTDGEELKLPEFPPGTLPPVGLPGNFLRRVREDESGKQGSRSSSLVSRRRKKKWDDGIGPGGPISQSAIFPQRRSQGEPMSPSRISTDQARRTDGMLSPTEFASPGPFNEKEPDQSSAESASKPAAAAEAPVSPTEEHRNPVEVYDQVNNIIIENREGEVLAVQPKKTESNVADQAKDLACRLDSETGPTGWTYDALKQRVMNWRDAELAKRKGKDKSARKAEPARAYQFGSTVCLTKSHRQYSLWLLNSVN